MQCLCMWLPVSKGNPTKHKGKKSHLRAVTVFKAIVFLCGTLPLGQNKEEAGDSVLLLPAQKESHYRPASTTLKALQPCG